MAALVGVPVILGKHRIESILPHRGRILFLDKVTFTDERVIGEFKVTEEVCESYLRDSSGKLIFPGIYFYEMAVQLLIIGIILLRNVRMRDFFITRYGEVIFMNDFVGRVGPNDKLIMELETVNIKTRRIESFDLDTDEVIGSEFKVRAGNYPRAKISSVELWY